MAKIVPSGALVDLGLPDESPYDKLLKLMQVGGGIMQGIGNIRARKDTSGAEAMEFLLEQVGEADSLARINQLKSMYDTIIDDNYVSNNSYYNVLKEQFNETNPNSAISTVSTNIKDVNVLASYFYQKLTSSDNEFGMPILDMGGVELYDYYDGLNNKEGWATQLAKERFELSTFNNLLNSTFGNKNPNYKIKYIDDSGEERSFRLGDVKRLAKKYNDQQEAIIFGALEDDIFSREEAMTIAAITGEDGRGVQSFFKIRDKKIADYQAMVTRSGKTQNNIINKLSSLIGKKDKTSNYQGILNAFIATGDDGGAGLKDGVMAMAQSPIVEKNYPAELGSLEGKSAEERFTKILEDMATDDGLTKDKLQFLLADVARENADDRTMGIAGLKAWGGSSKVEYKPDPRDVEKSLFDDESVLIPGQTDKFGYTTGISIGETAEREVLTYNSDIDSLQTSTTDESLTENPMINSGDWEEVIADSSTANPDSINILNDLAVSQKQYNNVDADRGKEEDWEWGLWDEAAIGTGFALTKKPVRDFLGRQIKNVQTGVKYMHATFGIGAKDITWFYENKPIQTLMNEINDIDDEIREASKKIKAGKQTIKGQVVQPRKATLDYMELEKRKNKRWNKIKNIVKNSAKSGSMRNMSDDQWSKLFKERGKWNYFKWKQNMLVKFPNGIKNVMDKSGRFINKFAGYGIAMNAASFLPETFTDTVPKQIVTTAATYRLGQSMYSKLKTVMDSPAAKKKLVSFLGNIGAKNAAKYAATGTAAGIWGGPIGSATLSILMTIASLGYTGYEAWNFIDELLLDDAYYEPITPALKKTPEGRHPAQELRNQHLQGIRN